MQELTLRERGREPRGPVPNLRQQIGGRGAGAIFAIERMGEPIRRAHDHGVGRFAANNCRGIDPDYGIMAGGLGGPLNNAIRFDEAIELRQTQRAAIPLERGETARLALPTGFKSEEAQLFFIVPAFIHCEGARRARVSSAVEYSGPGVLASSAARRFIVVSSCSARSRCPALRKARTWIDHASQ